MKTLLMVTAIAGLFLSALAACATGPTLQIPPVTAQVTPVKKTMRSFHSDQGANKIFRSCVDWYGNARPLFLRGRLFALLGYELVEGRMDDGRVREVRRVNYAPTQFQAIRNKGE